MDDTQRLILLNQYRILNIIEPDSGHDEMAEILSSGHTYFYRELYNAMTDEVPEEECRFVADVLAMYSVFERFLEDHPSSSLMEHHLRRFAGFDGNNEADLMVFARHAFERGLWGEVAHYAGETDNFNSHTPMRDAYQNMLSKWVSLGQPSDPTEQQLLDVISSAH